MGKKGTATAAASRRKDSNSDILADLAGQATESIKGGAGSIVVTVIEMERSCQ